MMRNEVFARHDHRFKSPSLARHFEGEPWYRARVDDAGPLLSEIERKNVALIRQVEKQAKEAERRRRAPRRLRVRGVPRRARPDGAHGPLAAGRPRRLHPRRRGVPSRFRNRAQTDYRFERSQRSGGRYQLIGVYIAAGPGDEG